MNPFLDGRRRIRNGWWILAFFLILAALVVPATVYASSYSSTLGIGWQAFLALLATCLCLALRREPLSTVLGPSKTWVTGVPLGAALGFGVWSLAALSLWVTGDVTWQASPDARTAVISGIAECAAVAAAEELIFRGFIFQRLIDGVGVIAAQILISAYFVLTHWGALSTTDSFAPLASANIFLASLLFGVCYLRTRSLAVPVSLHFMLNYMQGPLLGFGISGSESRGALVPVLGDGPAWWTGGSFGLEASAPGTAAVLLALSAVLFFRRPGVCPPEIV